MGLVSKRVNRSPTLGSVVSYSRGNDGIQSQHSDRSGIGQPIAQMPNRLAETRMTHNNFEILNVPHLEKVLANVLHKLSRQEGDNMQDLEVNG